jgi:hypothetical protein
MRAAVKEHGVVRRQRTGDMVVGATQERTAVAARSYLIWGEDLFKKGRYAAAEKLYQRAQGLVEQTFGTVPSDDG